MYRRNRICISAVGSPQTIPIERLEENEKTYSGCQRWWLGLQRTSARMTRRIQNPVLSSQFHVLLLIRVSLFSFLHLPSDIPFLNFWGRGLCQTAVNNSWFGIMSYKRTKGRGWTGWLYPKQLSRVGPTDCTVDGREGQSKHKIVLMWQLMLSWVSASAGMQDFT